MSKKSAPDDFSFFKDKLIDQSGTAEKPAAPAVGAAPVAPEARARTLPFDSTLKDKIIVVDDSPTILTVTSGILKTFGYAAIAFREPDVAWSEIQQMTDDELADIKAIFCDFEMKKMNGLELMKAVRGNPKLAAIPYVIMTGSSDRNLVQAARAMKVNGFMLKPISTNLIKSTLDNILPSRASDQSDLKRAK